MLVSAGPTFEPLDPVRFIGNRSSGKMGYALAAAARARGAEVTLVSGPTALAPPWGVTMAPVETALEMRGRILGAAETMDVVVMAAAVADHRPAEQARDKIHRPGESYALTLEPNPDILAELCSRRRPGQVIVGFAAEVGFDPAAAEAKLRRKGCDLLVVNDVSAPGAEFGADTNIVTLLAPGATPDGLPRLAKRELAERIWDRIETLRARRRGA